MKKLAITGTVSSGKSSVSRFFMELGAYVVSADDVVHHLLSSRADVRAKIVNLLGSDVIIDDQLNRKAIAKRAFSHLQTLKSLELILHPLVFYEIHSRYGAVKDNPKYNLFLAEIPLLYETTSEKFFDFVVAVMAREDLCRARFAANYPGEDFDVRFLRQLQPETKAQKADFILWNNGNLEDLKKEVETLASKLRSI